MADSTSKRPALPPSLLNGTGHPESLWGLDATLLDLLPVAVSFWNADGALLRSNRAALELAAGDRCPCCCDALTQALRTGQPERIARTNLERADGSRRCVRVYVDPIRDEAGTVIGAVSVLVDLGEEPPQPIDPDSPTALQEALRASEQRFTRFTQHLPGLAWIKDLQGRYVYANDAAVRAFRAPRAELYGKTDEDLFPPQTVVQFRENDRKALVSGSGVQVIETLEHEDGIVHYSIVSKFPIPGHDGAPALVGGVAFDITDLKNAEEALRTGEERLRLALEAGRMGAWDWDLHTNAVWWSDNLEQIHGLAPGSFGGTLEAFERLVHPDDRQAVRQAIAQAIEERSRYDAELRIVPPDGSVRWMIGKGKVVCDDDGQPVRMVGVGMDVTARRRAEEALEESELRFRTLASHVPVGIFQTDAHGQCTYVNERWCQLTGLTQAEALGSGWMAALHEADRTSVARQWDRAVATAERFTHEYRFQTRAGAIAWIYTNAVPLHNEQGAVIGYLGTTTDITEQKKLQNDLWLTKEIAEQRAAELDAVIDSMPDAVFFGTDAGITKCNANALKMLGMASLAELHHDAQELAARLAVRSPDNGTPLEPDELPFAQALRGASVIQEVVMRPIGAAKDMHVRVAAAPVLLNGEIVGAVAIHSDVTERKKVEQALREGDRRKDEFLATLAHELRNPLAPIKNGLQILKMPRLDAATAERSREVMERQVHHLVRLVDDLLDVSRVMRGKIELRKERVELATVIARAVETAQPHIEAQGHELTIKLCDESLLLEADPVRLAQVVGNLLTNAAKYTEPRGRIWITAQRQGNQVVLRVLDNGIGMAPDLLPRVFDLFVQAEHAAKRSQGGLGIGLTLVKSLIEMHHGTVEACSPGLGRGSEFVVRLPLAAESPDTAKGTGSGLPASAPAGRRVLVVDDNKDAADSLAILLGMMGHEVQVAHNGLTALERVKTQRPEMVLLDLGMPGMDGLEVARRLREMPERAGMVLAALTGWGQDSDRQRTAEAGFDHHLVKPVDLKVLEELLAGLGSRQG